MQLLTGHTLERVREQVKGKCWVPRRRPGAVDAALFPLKLKESEILKPFCLAHDPEGWFSARTGGVVKSFAECTSCFASVIWLLGF